MTEPFLPADLLFNAIPIPAFVVDDDVRILAMNRAAEAFLGRQLASVLHQRGGEVLHCLHAAATPGGCGNGPSCGECVIRNSVNQSIINGGVRRCFTDIAVRSGDRDLTLKLLVSTNPILPERTKVLLLIEDVTELATLQSLIPICMTCRKIRNDQQYWMALEEYFHARAGVKFTHGLCPECAQSLSGSSDGSL
jgi:hypothetical protein